MHTMPRAATLVDIVPFDFTPSPTDPSVIPHVILTLMHTVPHAAMLLEIIPFVCTATTFSYPT